jgi:ABC-2 type transport system permease protein
MSINRLLAVVWKETIHITRDTRSLVLALGMPLLLLFLFGYALSLDVDRVLTRFVDWDRTENSRLFKEEFRANRYFQVLPDAPDRKTVEQDILAGRVMLSVIIPRGFMSQERRQPLPSIQVLLDASDSLTANVALGYVNALASIHGTNVLTQRLNRMGLSQMKVPVEARPRIWYNPDLESRNFIIPGLIAVIAMIITAQLTALTMAREWETGTMEWLIATPVQPLELVFGKLLPYLAIGFLDMVISVAAGVMIFAVPLKGNVILLLVLCTLFLGGALSMGLLISIVTRAQLLASQVAVVGTFLPSFLLSGFVYPIYNMPMVLQYITYLVPTRYLIVIIKGIFLKGVGLAVLWVEALLLGIFGLLMVVLCIKLFKNRLAV